MHAHAHTHTLSLTHIHTHTNLQRLHCKADTGLVQWNGLSSRQQPKPEGKHRLVGLLEEYLHSSRNKHTLKHTRHWSLADWLAEVLRGVRKMHSSQHWSPEGKRNGERKWPMFHSVTLETVCAQPRPTLKWGRCTVHSTDHLKERGTEKGSGQCFTPWYWEQCSTQTNTGVVLKAKTRRLLKDGAQCVTAFLSPTMPSWVEIEHNHDLSRHTGMMVVC